jgi:hypothetical protein
LEARLDPAEALALRLLRNAHAATAVAAIAALITR